MAEPIQLNREQVEKLIIQKSREQVEELASDVGMEGFRIKAGADEIKAEVGVDKVNESLDKVFAGRETIGLDELQRVIDKQTDKLNEYASSPKMQGIFERIEELKGVDLEIKFEYKKVTKEDLDAVGVSYTEEQAAELPRSVKENGVSVDKVMLNREQAEELLADKGENLASELIRENPAIAGLLGGQKGLEDIVAKAIDEKLDRAFNGTDKISVADAQRILDQEVDRINSQYGGMGVNVERQIITEGELKTAGLLGVDEKLQEVKIDQAQAQEEARKREEEERKKKEEQEKDGGGIMGVITMIMSVISAFMTGDFSKIGELFGGGKEEDKGIKVTDANKGLDTNNDMSITRDDFDINSDGKLNAKDKAMLDAMVKDNPEFAKEAAKAMEGLNVDFSKNEPTEVSPPSVVGMFQGGVSGPGR